MILLKKITPKTVCGIITPGTTLLVAGTVSGVESGESAYGPWTRLLGYFEAHYNGTVYASSRAILPVIGDMLAQKYLGTRELISFKAEIKAAQADTPSGYQWVAETKEASSLLQLQSK